jgi:hypothetical protein
MVSTVRPKAKETPSRPMPRWTLLPSISVMKLGGEHGCAAAAEHEPEGADGLGNGACHQ